MPSQPQAGSLLFYHLGQNIGGPLAAELRGQGFPLWDSASRDELNQLLDARIWRAVVVQVPSLGPSALERCRRIRDKFSGPLAILVAPGAKAAMLELYALGVDDVIPWDQGPELIDARLRAMLKRTTKMSSTHRYPGAPLNLGEVVLDPARREVRRSGAAQHLTDNEYDLLHLLASRLGQVVSREEISDQLRGLPHMQEDRSIDLRISRLRRKLDDSGRRPRLIRTVRGLGYMLMPPSLDL